MIQQILQQVQDVSHGSCTQWQTKGELMTYQMVKDTDFIAHLSSFRPLTYLMS